MAALDQLPADERAVLQLVLQRGRGYDQIAELLGIDRAAVRQRALNAFDFLGPLTRVPPERRALITDYLLDQLPSKVADQVRERLRQSAGERAWARAIEAELAPIARGLMPEIPVETAEWSDSGRTPAASDPSAAGRPPGEDHAPARDRARDERARGEHRADPDGADEHGAVPAPASFSRRARAAAEAGTQAAGRARDSGVRAGRDGLAKGRPASSRRGGALLLAVVAVAIVVVIVLISSGGGSNSSSSSGSNSGAASSSNTSSTPSTGTTATTGTSTSTTARQTPKVIGQFSLAAADGSKAKGVVEVLREGKITGIAILASGLAANTKTPANAYAVWLYNSPSDNELVGYVSPGVGANGRLSTAGALPKNASHFQDLVLSLETTRKPKSPGHIVLQGKASGF